MGIPVQDNMVPHHDSLLTIEVHFDKLSTRALIDSGASAPVMSPELATKLGWQPRPYPTQTTQADGSKLQSQQVVSTQGSMSNKSDQKFKVDAEQSEVPKYDGTTHRDAEDCVLEFAKYCRLIELEEDEHILIAFSIAMTHKAARWWEYAEKALPPPKIWRDTKDAFLCKYGNILKKEVS